LWVCYCVTSSCLLDKADIFKVCYDLTFGCLIDRTCMLWVLLVCNFWLFCGLGSYVLGLLLSTVVLLVDRESMLWVR
jgi:hypothetical protein